MGEEKPEDRLGNSIRRSFEEKFGSGSAKLFMNLYNSDPGQAAKRFGRDLNWVKNAYKELIAGVRGSKPGRARSDVTAEAIREFAPGRTLAETALHFAVSEGTIRSSVRGRPEIVFLPPVPPAKP